MVTIATQPPPIELGRNELVGSHRDLNAHNVMFSATGLPAWPRWERASFAVLWGSRVDAAYDDDRVVAFLRGYLEGVGSSMPTIPRFQRCASGLGSLGDGEP